MRASTGKPPTPPLRFPRQARIEPLRYLAPLALGRLPRPWIGFVAVALLVQASLLIGDMWVLPPLAFCAFWWSDWGPRLTWLAPLLAGSLGAAWVTVGVSLLPVLPLLPACLIWISLAECLALLASVPSQDEVGVEDR